MSPPKELRPMPDSPKVLVVGTTPDYINWIRGRFPGRALFVTDSRIREQAIESRPAPAEEILCDLSDNDAVRRLVQRHVVKRDLKLDGVASYDCESMELAAILARDFSLAYPSVTAVNNCRNKFLTKSLWAAKKLFTPRMQLIGSVADAVHFFRSLNGPCVLKPPGGSGSELIFRCDSIRDCQRNYLKISDGLRQRRSNRLYKPFSDQDRSVLAEEFVAGEEYSCDFVIENGRIEIIRLTRKILSGHHPFGTALGYLLPGVLPIEISEQFFLQTLYRSASALGLERAVCMLDFLVHGDRIALLELSPRPGGDCLPFLLRHGLNLDPLALFLDFCQQRPLHIPKSGEPNPCLGLRLHARQSGILKKIDADDLRRDCRVREIHLIRKPGHAIKMPPEDYDSWLLGHIIFEPYMDEALEVQCQTLLAKLVVEVG